MKTSGIIIIDTITEKGPKWSEFIPIGIKQKQNMRNLSKENHRQLYRFQPATLRHCTSQKRLSVSKPLISESQVRVGNYKFSIQDVLGRGYSSKVYKGVEVGKQHKKYAIKAVDLKKFRGSNLDMLESEIQIHKSLSHDNIVKCHEVIKTPHHYYIILEYCPHGNLMDYINQKKKIGESMAIQIMQQILSAYKYLLEDGIIHRDLKPANILRIGNKWKIADFGFAVKTRFQFKDRINVGTPLYMPLEALTRNYYSYKTDVFAMGIILYEMLTGRTPWECRTQDQLLQKIREQEINFLDVKNNIAKSFIQRCCQNHESKRFLADEIKQFDFKSSQCLSNEDNKSKKTLSTCMSSGNLRLNTKSFRSSGATEESSSKSVQECEKQNAQILKNELQFCRMLYYMVVNIESFTFEAKGRQVFILTIYKYLLKSIKILENKKVNSFQLKSWDTFRVSKTHQNLYLQFTEYAVRYEKEYLDYVKHIDINSIRAVNRKFPQLAHNSPLTQRFYEEMHRFVSQMVREQNHEISQIYSKGLSEYEDKVQALDNLYQFYKGIDVKKTQLLNTEVDGTIEMQKIKVTQNYHETGLTSADYINLRKIIRSV